MKKPVIYGKCCVCGLPCISGTRLIAGADDCAIRHAECVVPKKKHKVSEK